MKLKKLDLSFNFLRSRLFSLMRSLVQPLEYLNLQDCRLDSTDIAYLNTTSMLKALRSCKELNLSMNDFSQSHTILFNIIGNCVHLNCLSISYCQIPIDIICQLARILSAAAAQANEQNDERASAAAAFSQLKVVFIQPFTPPKMHEIIDLIHSFSALTSLQKFFFLPSLYAFPGNNDLEREASAMSIITTCSSILESKNRGDIEFVNP